MMPRALSSWCSSTILVIATLGLVLSVDCHRSRPAAQAPDAEAPDDEALCAALGQWFIEDSGRTLEERRTAARLFGSLLQEAADAVVREDETLDAATQRLHEFCASRFPEQLRYHKFFYNLDSARAEMRVSLLWHIRVGLARGEYTEVPAAIAERFVEIPPRIVAQLPDRS